MTFFRPIDYQGGPDITGPLQLFLAARNAATQRKFAENTERRQSAQEHREEQRFKAEQEALTHQRQLETSRALPSLFSAARRMGAPAASELGKPYGVSFEQEAPPELTELPATPMAAARATAPKPPAEEMPDLSTLPLPPGVGPMLDMAQRARKPASDEELLQLAGQAASPEGSLEAALEPGPSKLFARTKDKRFEVPEVQEPQFGTAGKAAYNALIGAGKSDAEATVAALKADAESTKETGRNERADLAVGARLGEAERARPDVATQEDWLMRRLAQSDINSRRAAAAKVNAAGVEKPGAADSSEARIQGAFVQDYKDFRDRTAQAQKEVQSARNIREIRKLAFSNNPVEQALAVEQIGKIAHGGNTVTKATQDLIYHHMGGALERLNAMTRQVTHHGTLAPQQLKYLRETAAGLAAHHAENAQSIKRGEELQFGAGTQYDTPYMRPVVRQHLNALNEELGLPIDEEGAQPTEGALRLGRRRGAVTGAAGGPKPKAAPQPETDDEFLNRILK